MNPKIQKEITTNLTPKQIEHKKKFLKDLRANPYKAREMMRDIVGPEDDENWGRCCLCVAYDTAQRLGASLPEDDGEYPPDEICEFYGWPDKNPFLRDNVRAADWNDKKASDPGGEFTHAMIADLFEEEFPQLKEG